MNRVAQANDALFALVTATFPTADGWFVSRNVSDAQKPKSSQDGAPALYCDQLDDESPQTLRAFAGLLFDLKVEPKVTVVFLGREVDRRAAAWSAVEALKAALLANPTLGGAVEYARCLPPEDASADRLEWMAGGLRVPVELLFNAPSEAG